MRWVVWCGVVSGCGGVLHGDGGFVATTGHFVRCDEAGEVVAVYAANAAHKGCGEDGAGLTCEAVRDAGCTHLVGGGQSLAAMVERSTGTVFDASILKCPAAPSAFEDRGTVFAWASGQARVPSTARVRSVHLDLSEGPVGAIDATPGAVRARGRLTVEDCGTIRLSAGVD